MDYFDHWVYPEIITKLCTILVMPRKPYSGSSLAEKIQKLNELYSADIRMIECEEYPVSSSEIRTRLLNRNPDEKDFPNGVLDYIHEHNLYNG